MKKSYALGKFTEVIKLGILYECLPEDIANQIINLFPELKILPPGIQMSSYDIIHGIEYWTNYDWEPEEK